jgi:hypothetical protein
MASCDEYGHDCGHCTDCQGSMTGGNLTVGRIIPMSLPASRCAAAINGRQPYPTPQPAAAAERLLKFFCYTHLRADLQAVSKPFGELAQRVVEIVPAGPERTVALRKLLEAKDAAVRAVAIPE